MKMGSRRRVDISLIDPFNIRELVDQDNHGDFASLARDVCDPGEAYEGVTETLIPVDMSGLLDARIMTAAPGTRVPAHAHEGPIFRFISSGEAIINGKTYTAGDWMVIPHGVEYSVESPSGYMALWNCVKC